VACHLKWGEKAGQRTESNIGSGFWCLFMDQETKRMHVCRMFVFLLWSPRPRYYTIAYVGTSTTTSAKTLGTPAGQTRSTGASATSGGVCWFRKKLRPGAVPPSMLWLAVFQAKLTTTPASLGPDSVSSAIAFEAATATVFSNFINHMGAGRQ